MALHKSGVGNCHQSLTFGLALDWLGEVKSVAGLHCSPANELRANEASALKCTETLIQSALADLLV